MARKPYGIVKTTRRWDYIQRWCVIKRLPNGSTQRVRFTETIYRDEALTDATERNAEVHQSG